MTRQPIAASCMVLPPGAAQRSSARRPSPCPASRAGKAAAASCAHQPPASNPDSAETRPGAASLSEPDSVLSPSGVAAPGLVVRSSGGSARWAAAMARATGFPQSAFSRWPSHFGTPAIGLAPSQPGPSASFRRTAFTMPAAPCARLSDLASRTAASTTPWGARPSALISTAPSLRISRTGPFAGRWLSASTARSAWPRWRKTARASRSASALTCGAASPSAASESGSLSASDRLISLRAARRAARSLTPMARGGGLRGGAPTSWLRPAPAGAARWRR